MFPIGFAHAALMQSRSCGWHLLDTRKAGANKSAKHGSVQTGLLCGWKMADRDPNELFDWSIQMSMREEDKAVMEKYGITYEPRTVFFCKGYKYERLVDAVNYAKLASADTKSTG
jgi:hypothetical protein